MLPADEMVVRSNKESLFNNDWKSSLGRSHEKYAELGEKVPYVTSRDDGYVPVVAAIFPKVVLF
jgi:hypothetical protein